MLDPLCRMSSNFPPSREIVQGPGFNPETAWGRVDTQSVTCYFQWS